MTARAHRLSCPLVATGTMPPANSIKIRFHHLLPVVSAAARKYVRGSGSTENQERVDPVPMRRGGDD